MKKIKILQQKNNSFLFINNDLWMWDTPRERELQNDLNKQAFRDVLVAGYGFGIVTNLLLKNPKVKSVTTVEKYKEILNAVKKIGQIKGEIIINDFYKLPTNKKFDCIIGDIWQDIDAKFLKDYVKFKQKALKLLKRNGKILAWGKDYYEYLLQKQKTKAKHHLT